MNPCTRDGGVSLRIDDVVGCYYLEVGQHHAGTDTAYRDLTRLVEYFGADKDLYYVTGSDVARLAAWRRWHRVTRHGKGKKSAGKAALIANATVNRGATGGLKKLFTRAKAWGVKFNAEPVWKLYFLGEPHERVRELQGNEAYQIEDATRDDTGPFSISPTRPASA